MIIDSPFDRCPVCKEYVLLDGTQPQCAQEHGCAPGQKCPLLAYFEGQKYEMPAPPPTMEVR